MARKIDLVCDNNGYGIGIYVDGKLVGENQCYSESELLRVLGIKHNEHWIDMENSRLPKEFNKVKLS